MRTRGPAPGRAVLAAALWLAATPWTAAPVLAQVAQPGQGLRIEGGGGPASCTVAPGTACLRYDHPSHARCGTQRGPGCRKADGRCAAWQDGYTPDCRSVRPGQ